MTAEQESSEILWRQAVVLFNQREFFTCHDVLEELWSETLGTDRAFYQGLIHAAVSLHHFQEGNLTGARKMHDSAVRYLQEYGDRHRELDLNRFRKDFDRCFASLLNAGNTYPSGVTLDDSLIPLLHPAL